MKTYFRLSACLALIGLAGCNVLPEPQTDTLRYFTLSAPPAAPAVADATTVRPVQLASHLRNRAMAVRVSEHEIIYLDDVRWAESLSDAVPQLLRARLASTGGSNVVSVQLQRFELVRSEGNAVQLAATYTIFSRGDNASPIRGTFAARPQAWDGKDYGALVGQLRDAVNELADAIAAALPQSK